MAVVTLVAAVFLRSGTGDTVFCLRTAHRRCPSRWRSCGGVGVHFHVSAFVLVELSNVPVECGAAPEEDLGDAEPPPQPTYT